MKCVRNFRFKALRHLSTRVSNVINSIKLNDFFFIRHVVISIIKTILGKRLCNICYYIFLFYLEICISNWPDYVINRFFIFSVHLLDNY